MTGKAVRKSPAIHFIEPRSAADGQVIGLNVAVESFLDAFSRHTRHDRFFCHAADTAAFEAFRKRIAAAGADPARCDFLPAGDPAALDRVSTLFRPDPGINSLVAARGARSHDSHAVCGLSHTMSPMQVMSTMAVAVAEPLQAWDAIVCPSRAIRSVVETLWRSAGQGAPLPPADLPVIPLGIDTERFADNADPARRAAQRAALGVGENDFVILFLGRLSYHNKAHPLPMLLAAERVARQSGAPVHMVFYGYFTGEGFRRDYEALAGDVCETARVHFVGNDDPRFPDALWAGADVFVSPVDNVQESFGLTPVEAMASGLPAVISDWDGYRDTVRDGTDGFLLPTLAPPPGTGEELVRRYLAGTDVYGEYLAGASQSTAIDVDAMTSALQRLAMDTDLRHRMGEAGRKRAREVFDWRQVIPAYEELWEELDSRREAGSAAPPAAANAITGPRELDTFSVFRDFPTATLGETDEIAVVPNAARELTRRLRHRMNMFLPVHLLAAEELPRLLAALRRPATVTALVDGRTGRDRVRLLLTLVWLVKMGVATHRPASASPDGG